VGTLAEPSGGRGQLPRFRDELLRPELGKLSLLANPSRLFALSPREHGRSVSLRGCGVKGAREPCPRIGAARPAETKLEFGDPLPSERSIETNTWRWREVCAV